jgi:hypothetical protein
MASTRNKNTPGDYSLEQSTIERQSSYIHYQHSSYGKPVETMYAGNGLCHGRIPVSNLSHNPEDIESFLFGIGSTNLVSQKPDITPEIKQLKHLSIMDRIPFILPESLVVQPNQRNLWT